MADKNILSVIATVGSKLSDLAIKNGQLIFIQDKHKIALDFGGKRVFYNEIQELESEAARTALLAPISGAYYFVIDTAVLWTYNNGWKQITTRPEDIISIGASVPELGSAGTLYVDTGKKEISVWDAAAGTYVVVAEKTKELSAADIDALFNK